MVQQVKQSVSRLKCRGKQNELSHFSGNKLVSTMMITFHTGKQQLLVKTS